MDVATAHCHRLMWLPESTANKHKEASRLKMVVVRIESRAFSCNRSSSHAAYSVFRGSLLRFRGTHGLCSPAFKLWEL